MAAANLPYCGRVFCRSWRRSVCRLHRIPRERRQYTAVPALAPLRAAAILLPHPAPRQRCCFTSTKVVLEETAPPPSGGGLFARFFRWLDDDSEPGDVMGQEEKDVREALLVRLQDMYFSKPPQLPGLTFYKEAFQTLIKYNDRVGVDTLWRFMREDMNVQPDTELTELVEPFMEKAQRNRWFD